MPIIKPEVRHFMDAKVTGNAGEVTRLPRHLKIFGHLEPVETGLETDYIKFGPVSLDFKTEDMPIPEWMKTGYQLGVMAKAAPFWVGDWINYGEAKYGEKYAQALEMGIFDEGTLKNMAYVCRKVAKERRRHNLFFNHHTEVAPLSAEKQEYYLGRAEEEQLTVFDLRRLITTREKKDAVKVEAKNWFEWFVDYTEEKKLNPDQSAIVKIHAKVAFQAGGRAMKKKLGFLFDKIMRKEIRLENARKMFDEVTI